MKCQFFPRLSFHSLILGGLVALLLTSSMPLCAQQSVVVDSADATGVLRVGAWTSTSSNAQKYGSGYWHDGNTGKGSKRVSFTPVLTEAGEYEVYLWWPSASNFASNVPVDIIHNGGTDYIQINQRANGGRWILLGSYAFEAGSTGRVTINTTGTNGTVVADAVLFHKKGLIVDNNNSNNSGGSISGSKGSWVSANLTPGYVGNNYHHDNNTGKGLKSFRWTPNLTAAGYYTVYLRWTSGSNRASNVPVEVGTVGAGDLLEVNQQLSGGMWVELGKYWFPAGIKGYVEVGTTATTGRVIADAAMFVPDLDLNPDTDGDGLPDGYEEQVGLNPDVSDSALDSDNDGLSNLEEYNLGTNPLLGDSDADGLPDGWEVGNNFNPLDKNDGTVTTVTFTSGNVLSYGGSTQDVNVNGYEILDGGQTLRLNLNTWKAVNLPITVSNNLLIKYDVLSDGQLPEVYGIGLDRDTGVSPESSWQNGGSQLWGLQNHLEQPGQGWKSHAIRPSPQLSGSYNYLAFIGDADAAQQSRVSYRNVRIGPDNDRDGLFNNEEFALGTDPSNPDSDGDGMPDGLELAQGLDPRVDDSLLDADGDGLLNSQEYARGTGIQNADTDSDGLPDGWEVDYGLNPLNAADGNVTLLAFTLANVRSYGGSNQDLNPTGYEILDNGQTLRLTGNTWKAVNLPITVSNNLLIKYDVLSDGQQPEVYGIGLDRDTGVSPESSWQNGGSQPWGLQNHLRWPGQGWQNHAIHPSTQLSGSYNFVAFIGDADAAQQSRVSYRNVRIGPDNDRDGLFNNEEFALGTDPTNPDSDGDLMADGWESRYGLNPLVSNAGGDLDGDGWTNLEEFVNRSDPSQDDAGTWEEAGGLVVIEAEDFDANLAQGIHTWNVGVIPGGYSGSGTVSAQPDTGTIRDSNFTLNSPRLDYRVRFTQTGNYRVWIRGHAQGSTGRDSVHLGLNGKALETSDRLDWNGGTSWKWSSNTGAGTYATIRVDQPGIQTINLWMREDGAVVDKLLLTLNNSYTPAGTGPEISTRLEPEPALPDTDNDGMPDAWETLHGLNPNDPADGLPTADLDGDSLSNLQEYLADSDPTNYFSQAGRAITPTLNIISGNNQTGEPSTFVQAPLVVQVKDATTGLPLPNAPITFSVQGGYAGLASTNTGAPTLTASLPLRTDFSGNASVWFLRPVAFSTTTQILVQSAGVQTTLNVLTPRPSSDEQWQLEEPSGVTAINTGLGNYNGTLTGGAARVGSGFDSRSAVQLDGLNDYITFGNPADRVFDFGTDSFSLALWVKFTEVQTAPGHYGRRILTKGHHGWNSGYFIGLRDSGKIEAGVGSTTSTRINSLAFKTTAEYNDGQWHHVALVIDQATKQARLYIDGIPSPLTLDANTGGQITGANNEIVNFANMPNLNASRPDQPLVAGSHLGIYDFFKGTLDDIQITDRALTPAQVTALFNQDSDNDTLPDRWEAKLFGNLNQNASADSDGDGLTNLQEYLQGSDPKDYYNGQGPVVVIRGGDNQSGLPGEIVGMPLWVRIKNADHVAIPYATIRYSIEGANGQIALSPTGTFLTTQDVYTGDKGEAVAYLKLSGSNGAVNRVKVTFGTGVQAVYRHFEAKVSIPPPTPVLTIVSADNQTGTPGDYLLQPLRVEVRDGSPTGPPLSNRDVTFSVSSGGGGFAVVSGAPASINKTVTTDANGVAEIYFQLPLVPALINTITAQCRGAKFVDFVVTCSFSSTDLPPPPQAMRIVENSDGSADYSWIDVSANEEYFFIEREKADGSLERITLPANTTSYHYVPQP